MAGATEVMEQAERGRVTTLFCEAVPLARSQLRAAAEELEPVPTLVQLEWERAPSLARELDEIRDALADAARSLWPAWYVSAEERFHEAPASGGIDALVAKIGALHPGASVSWLRDAYHRCQVGRRPLVRRLASAEQVRQLAFALDPARLVFALSVNADQASSARLRGLARGAAWLAHESQAKTLLVVPEGWRGHAELDHVTYGALTLELDPPQVRVQPMVPPPAGFVADSKPCNDVCTGSRAAHVGETEAGAGRQGPHVSVGPIAGKPHPASEVEQLVSARLAADAELRGMFECNQRLSAFGGKHYIVDLVWRTGKLVIELDGPEHNGQLAYARDRERDYRLLVSGYSTLRVPNAEVCVDVDSVITKIRHVVHRLSPVRKEISQ